MTRRQKFRALQADGEFQVSRWSPGFIAVAGCVGGGIQGLVVGPPTYNYVGSAALTGIGVVIAALMIRTARRVWRRGPANQAMDQGR